MGKLGRAEKHALLVEQLMSTVAEQQRAVDALVQRRRHLNARAYATAAVVTQVEALLALSMALEQQQRTPCDPASSESGATGVEVGPSDGSESGASAAASPPLSSSPDVQAELAQIMQQLREESSVGSGNNASEGAATSAAGGSGAADAADAVRDGGRGDPPMTLGWSPAHAAQIAPSVASELTTEGLRKKLRGLVSVAGCLLP